MTAPDAPDHVPGELPLQPSDPTRVDAFWLEARVASSPAGVAYLACEQGTEQRAVVVLLARGAARDPAARDRFTGAVDALHLDAVIARGGEGQESGRSARRFRPEPTDDLPTLAPTAPWVALAAAGAAGTATVDDTAAVAADLLERTGLADVTGSVSAAPARAVRPAGIPSYRFSWQDDTASGVLRSWPLPWPGRFDRAGWRSVFAAWMIMMLIAALAVLIAWLVFSRMPPQTVTQPWQRQETTTASASPTPGSPSGSASSSPTSSGSSSGSPSPSTSGSEQPDPRTTRL